MSVFFCKDRTQKPCLIYNYLYFLYACQNRLAQMLYLGVYISTFTASVSYHSYRW